MPIVADTTVFRYLVVLEVTDILPALFEHVLIPPAVLNELQRASTPAVVRTWFANLPPWVRIQPPITPPDPTLSYLGDGEQEAIQLVHEQQAPLLVTDDRQAYNAALARSIPVTRTLRDLEMAVERGLLDFPTIVTRLRAAGFYTPEDVVEEMLARDAERKRQQSENQEQG
jgi:predicted nucleic acid-binding protein